MLRDFVDNTERSLRYHRGDSVVVFSIINMVPYVKLLNWSTMICTAIICALVHFPQDCGTNTGFYEWSWSTENEATNLLSVSLHMNPIFPFCYPL